MAKRFLFSLLVAAFCLLTASALVAQVATSGRLLGTVSDQTGAVIAGAKVTVHDDVTGATVETKTGADGTFSVGNLSPSLYTVTVTLQGFKKAESRNVKIEVGKTYDLSIKMEVGAIESTIVVEAGAEVLETASTTVGSTIMGKSITQLPFTSRDALDLAVLMPGAATTGRVRQTSFMGLPKGAINITYDGINAQDNINKSSDGFFTTIRPRVDSIEEFGISTAGQGADQSGEGAVQIRFETKRGGNQYAGSAWWYHRNDFLNANYFFSNQAGLPRQRMRLNQYGYRVGGPIIKDKLFFFHAFDFWSKPDSILRTRTILTQAALQGQFTYAVSAIPTIPAGNTWTTCNATALTCTATLLGSPTSLAAANTQANAVDATVGTLLGAVDSSRSAPGVGFNPAPSLFQESISFNNVGSAWRKYPDFRFDWNITQSHTFSAIYHFANFHSTPDTLNSRDYTYPVAPYNTNQASQNSNRSEIVGKWRWNIGQTKSNEVTFGIVSAPIWFFNDMNPAIYPTIQTNLGAIRVNPGSFAGMVSSPFFAYGPAPRNTALWQLNDNFSWVKGKHNISIGFGMTQLYGGIQSNNAEVGSLTLGMSSFDPANAMFVLGNFPGLSGATGTTQVTNATNLYAALTGRVTAHGATVYLDVEQRQFVTGAALYEKYRQNEFGFYVTDKWRIIPTLTLDFGVRWQYEGSPYDTNNVYFEMANGAEDVWGVSGGADGLFNPGASGGAFPTYRLKGSGGWYDRDLNNFAPNLGLNWTPTFDNKLYNMLFGGPGKSSFRAGFSTTYSREGTGNFLSMSEGNPGYYGSHSAAARSAGGGPGSGTFTAGTVFWNQISQSATPLDSVLRTPSTFQTTMTLDMLASRSVNVFRKDLQLPTVYSWNIGIQRELTPNMVVEIRYVGNKGTGLWRQYDVNEVNIFENGLLSEFGIARTNLLLCQANPGGANGTATPTAGSCQALQMAAGVPASQRTGSSFANWGLAGQANTPIFMAAFTGSTTSLPGPNNTNFRSSTFVTPLTNNLPGSVAGTLAGVSFLCNLVGSQPLQGPNPTTPCPSTAPLVGAYPVNFLTVNPHARGGSYIMTNDSHSSYHSLQVEFRRRLAKGLQFTANYVWSKSLSNIFADSGSSFAGFTTLRDKGYDKGKSPWDIPHALKVNSIWELPFGPGKKWNSSQGWVNRIIEGWELSGINRWQSGRIFLLTSGLGGTVNGNDPGVNLLGLNPNQIQDLLSIRKLPNGRVYWFPDSLVNSSTGTANFTYMSSCQTPGQLCNRVFLRGPSFFRMDLNIVKRTYITEKINIEFRAEFLNAFNNINFFFPGAEANSVNSASLQSTSFGRSTAAYRDFSTTDDPGGRLIQLVMRVNF